MRMDEDGTNLIVSTRKITELMTPVSEDVAYLLTTALEAHGAQVVWVSDYPNDRGVSASLYRITFPEGSEKRNGLLLSTSRSFHIQFPDGFKLYGIDQWGMGEDKVILFLPEAD